MDAAPRFRHGTPVLRAYRDDAELTRWLEDRSVDVVVSIRSAKLAHKTVGADHRPIFVELQHVIDTFVGQSPDDLLSCDLIATCSPWWLRWAFDYYQAEGLTASADQEASLTARVEPVGMPQLDAAGLIDPDEVRRRWNLPRDKPVVVFFPFPQGVGHAGFWSRKIFGEHRRWRQLASVMVERRFEYLPHVWRGWNDRGVVEAVRRFCDANGAHLLVKSRLKTPIPEYLAEAADQCLYDEQVYPPTILEALSVASLSISYYSVSVLESVALGVPHVCVPFQAEDYFADGRTAGRPSFTRFFEAREGGAFQFRGVTTVMDVASLMARLPGMQLSEFSMNHEAGQRYIAQFLTHNDGKASGRLVDAIERRVQERQAASAVETR